MLDWIKRKIGKQEANEEKEEKQDIETATAETEEAPDETSEEPTADNEEAIEDGADLVKHKAYDFSKPEETKAEDEPETDHPDPWEEAPAEDMPRDEGSFESDEASLRESEIVPEDGDANGTEPEETITETEEVEEVKSEVDIEARETKDAISSEKSFDEADEVASESETLPEEAPETEAGDQKTDDADEGEEKVGWFKRLKQGLEKTRDDMNFKINDILGNYVKIDDEMMEDLEDLLISSDMGMETTMTLIDRLKESIREKQIQDPKEVKGLLADEIRAILEDDPEKNRLNVEPSPAIILIVGVNGVGKTTTIGKLAYRFKNEGKSVLIAAADTFRAAAIEQVETWGERSGTPVISHKEGADPAAVVYDAIQAQKSRKIDVLICDTAGRLHNKKNLMNELEKIHRIIEKEAPEAQKESLLVLDATTGQNAILQAKTFDEVTNLSGLILTKLDGTAKGGVVLPLVQELDIPIKLIGVGEGMLDLQDFSGKDFANALINAE